MTWIDNNGEVRPQSWEEYCEMVKNAPDWTTTQRLMRSSHPGPPQPQTVARRLRRVRNRQPSRAKPKPKELQQTLRMRVRLFRADPHCFWCGVKVVMEKAAEKQPDFATVDHLYSRWHPERRERHVRGDGVLHVLACSSCNGERAGAENQSLPFTPKLPERWEFARLADATLARQRSPVKTPETSPVSERPMRVIQTLEEAIEFAREKPSR